MQLQLSLFLGFRKEDVKKGEKETNYNMKGHNTDKNFDDRYFYWWW